nr:MAG TPA: hypothetical protein [Caudoviricetes sp.]
MIIIYKLLIVNIFFKFFIILYKLLNIFRYQRLIHSY